MQYRRVLALGQGPGMAGGLIMIERKVPPRGKFTGCDPKGEIIRMTGKEWNELAAARRFKWKRVGDPREGIGDLCGGGYEVWVDGTRAPRP